MSDETKPERGSFTPVSESEKMTHEQALYFQNRAVDAYDAIADLAPVLAQKGINILALFVSVAVPGHEHPKVVTIANPGLDPEELKELITLSGQEAAHCVTQAVVIAKASNLRDQALADQICPDCEDDESFIRGNKEGNETIH